MALHCKGQICTIGVCYRCDTLWHLMDSLDFVGRVTSQSIVFNLLPDNLMYFVGKEVFKAKSATTIVALFALAFQDTVGELAWKSISG